MLRPLFATALLLLCLTAPSPAAEPVEFVRSSLPLSPTSTFEIRFRDPMVPAEKVGQTLTDSPVAFKPAIEGTFTWLDQRRGVFAPKGSLPLATTYQMRLADGLTDLTGKVLEAEFRETIQTPPMLCRGGKPLHWINSSDAQPTPEISLLFNVNVDAATAAPYLKFVDADGRQIAARLDQTAKEYHHEHLYSGYARTVREMAPWDDLHRLTMENADPKGPPRNQVLVTPAQPLPAGQKWVLRLQPGLPAADSPLRLLQSFDVAIGTVRPFDVMTATAENFIDSGKSLRIVFSKPLAKSVTAHNVARWISISPEPDDLTATVSGREVSYRGTFLIGTKYTVTVEPSLPCSAPMLLARRYEDELIFDRVPPRIYFEEFQAHQYSSGTRKFHLRAVNVPSVRVTAKLFQRETVSGALNEWRKYEEGDGRPAVPDEFYHKIDAANLPGQTIFQQDFPLDPGQDESTQLALDWDQILGAGKTGVVLLTAEAPESAKVDAKKAPVLRPGAQAIVQVTDLGLVWKRSRHESFLYLFSLRTGQPLPGAKVQFYSEKDEALGETTADASGCARLASEKDAAWILMQNGADLHMVTYGRYLSHLDFTRQRSLAVDTDEDEDRSFVPNSSDPDRRVLLFTERGVYRPGETIHLKGVGRDFQTGASLPPAGEQLNLWVTDAKEREIFRRTLTFSELGSFNLDIPLPKSNVGQYTITAGPVPKKRTAQEEADDDDDYSFRAGRPWQTLDVSVQEFVPNAFEVTVGSPGPVVGEKEITLPISARYYMGKSLSQAEAKWTLKANDTEFRPAGFDGYFFCDAINDYRLRKTFERVGEFSEQGTADLSEEGKAMVENTIPLNPKAPQPRSARLLCEITDLDQQTVSADRSFIVHSSDFYLGVRSFPRLVREGETLPVQLVAVGNDGQPWKEAINAAVRLTRVTWQTNKIEGAGGGTSYTNEPIFQLAGQATVPTLPLQKEGRKWVPAKDAPASTLAVSGPGLYLLEATTEDANGRPVTTTLAFNVYGSSATTWNYRNEFQVELVPDKELYQPGDKARLLIKTPIAGQALVTVERENVRRSFIAKLEDNAPSVEVPIEDADAPNVFVSVMLLRGAAESPRKYPTAEYRVGYAKLKIDRPAARLSIYVHPDAPAHRPGDAVTLTAEVLDNTGKPVPNAELTLYAVDEGILSLTGYETPDPYTFFFHEHHLAVATGLTLSQMLDEDPEERDFINKGYLVGGGGDDDQVRKNFLACAYWSAALKTGPDGRVISNFTAPDSLTRYRLIAVAQTKLEQFGAGESALEINKPVMLEPAPPRFGNVGDKILLRALVHNTTKLAGEADVELALDGTVKAPETKRRIRIPANGSLALDFPVEFIAAGEARWIWKTTFTSTDGQETYKDAAEVKLHVGYPTPLEREVQLTRIDTPQADVLTQIPQHLLDGVGTVKVTLTNSRIIEAGDAIRSLLHYPYGCVEQTTSSTLPWLTLRSFQPALPDLQRSDDEISAMVQRGVDRLMSMQTDSGGLAYWPGSPEPLLWASAYGGFGLATAQKLGYPVPEEDVDRIWAYLSQQLRGLGGVTSQRDFSEYCLALYTLALAGKAEPSYHELLFQKRQLLSRDNRSLLALAILESKGPEQMVEALLDSTQPAPNPDYYWYGNESRRIAMELFAWSHFRPQNPTVDRLVNELLAQRSYGSWSTTQGNAWAMLALASYTEKVETARAGSQGAFIWSTQKQAFELPGKASVATATFPLQQELAKFPLRVTHTGTGRLFGEVQIESRPRNLSQPARDQGYRLQRRYLRVNDDETVTPLDNDLHVGDRVLVELNFTCQQAATYVALDDPLPSVFEAIHPEFKSQATVAGEHLNDRWETDFRELREDRALFFRNYVSPGRYTVRYLARVRAAGIAIAPSAKIEEMYHPEHFGQTATERVTALPLK